MSDGSLLCVIVVVVEVVVVVVVGERRGGEGVVEKMSDMVEAVVVGSGWSGEGMGEGSESRAGRADGKAGAGAERCIMCVPRR